MLYPAVFGINKNGNFQPMGFGTNRVNALVEALKTFGFGFA